MRRGLLWGRVLRQLKSQTSLAEVRKRPARLVGHQGVCPGADAVGAAQSSGAAFVGVVTAVREGGRVLRGGLVAPHVASLVCCA
jgi:dihydroorotate dehydrogenase